MADDKFYRLLDMQERQITPAEYDFVRDCLSYEDPLVRIGAVPLIVDSPHCTEDDIGRLMDMCGDSDADVRAEVYEALSKVNSAKAADKLQQMILSEKDDTARGWAIAMWADSVTSHTRQGGEYGRQTAFVLKTMKRRENKYSDFCSLSCMYALYRFGYPYALDKMLRYLYNEDYQIRCAAVNDLRYAARQSDIPKIIKALEERAGTEEYESVRSAAYAAIRELGGTAEH